MRDWAGKRYWVVGASAGLGRALAERLSALGVHCVLSARSADELRALADALPGRSTVVPCDVTDGEAVAEAAEAAGEVDGMVFVAGVYWPMSATEWDAEKAVAMGDVNFLGCLRVCGALVPKMVARGHGHIVLVGSLAGFRGLPGNIGYGASKAAVMSLAETMRADLAGTGVEVQLANPGFIRTRLTDKNDFAMPQMMEPEAAAREIVDHMGEDGFSKSFPAGLSTLIRSGQFIPEGVYYALTGRSRR